MSLVPPTAYSAIASSWRCGERMSAREAPQRRSPPICMGTSVLASVSSASRALGEFRCGSLGADDRTGSVVGTGTWKCPSAVIWLPPLGPGFLALLCLPSIIPRNQGPYRKQVAVGQLSAEIPAMGGRVRRTVALLQRRGYALAPSRLAAICLGGPLTEQEVRWATAADPELALAEGLVVERATSAEASSIRDRADGHATAAPEYLEM